MRNWRMWCVQTTHFSGKVEFKVFETEALARDHATGNERLGFESVFWEL